MLAYLFWHRPFAQVEQQLYEASITRFQADLAAHPPPGFISAASFKIDPVPWLGDQAGYEDWYLLEGSWAMDPLNAYAITGHRQASHDSAAAQMADGCGGLYADAGGEFAAVPQSTLFWLTRPRGVRWQDGIAAVRAHCPQANCWRRQMVLGPAAEFAVAVPGDAEIDVPAGWQARRVPRLRLPRQTGVSAQPG